MIARGVGPDVLVGLCIERSLSMIVAICAILKAQGAYLPLDPAYPIERLTLMLQDSAATIVLTRHHLRAMLPETAAVCICLDSDWGAYLCGAFAR